MLAGLCVSALTALTGGFLVSTGELSELSMLSRSGAVHLYRVKTALNKKRNRRFTLVMGVMQLRQQSVGQRGNG